MFEIQQNKYLWKSCRHLHVFFGQSKPQMPSSFIHVSISVSRCIDNKRILVINLMEMQKFCCSWIFRLPCYIIIVKNSIYKRAFTWIKKNIPTFDLPINKNYFCLTKNFLSSLIWFYKNFGKVSSLIWYLFLFLTSNFEAVWY